ncbi:MAG: recombination regulator RecX [Candidatus Accumulibacter sp.]|uniref:recombination regulator RecX n=1 Tax=Accumulibacter sp. TaxID=2053492 RepID=UPI001A410BFD|nr:recombination regulator RecX [Accumulibacter sp.]MBL8394403.1 recombination regulator RecX [Accumulibacter sp.]
MPDALRECALRLLARREHSRQELSDKLASLAEDAEQLAALLDDLTEKDLLSDQRYADMRLKTRAARFGDARLTHELRTKGIADEVVGTVIKDGTDELTRARRVWQRRFGEQATAADDFAERARQARFLAGRGFSGETIRRLLRTTPEDD